MSFKQGYNSIFLAGTGYVKSLVFDVSATLGGQRRLKSLQKDQVRELVKGQNNGTCSEIKSKKPREIK